MNSVYLSACCTTCIILVNGSHRSSYTLANTKVRWLRAGFACKVVFPAYVDRPWCLDGLAHSIHPPGQPPPRWWSNPPVLLLPRWLVALSLDMTLVIVRTVPVSAALALWWLGFQPLQLPLLSTAMSSVLVLLSSLHASSRENRQRSTAEGVNPAHHRDSHVMFRACR